MNVFERLGMISIVCTFGLLANVAIAQAVTCTFVGTTLNLTTDENGCCRLAPTVNSSGCGTGVMITYEYSPCDENGDATTWYTIDSVTYFGPFPRVAVKTICDFEHCLGYGHKLSATLSCGLCGCTAVCQVTTGDPCVECGHCE